MNENILKLIVSTKIPLTWANGATFDEEGMNFILKMNFEF